MRIRMQLDPFPKTLVGGKSPSVTIQGNAGALLRRGQNRWHLKLCPLLRRHTTLVTSTQPPPLPPPHRPPFAVPIKINYTSKRFCPLVPHQPQTTLWRGHVEFGIDLLLGNRKNPPFDLVVLGGRPLQIFITD